MPSRLLPPCEYEANQSIRKSGPKIHFDHLEGVDEVDPTMARKINMCNCNCTCNCVCRPRCSTFWLSHCSVVVFVMYVVLICRFVIVLALYLWSTLFDTFAMSLLLSWCLSSTL